MGMRGAGSAGPSMEGLAPGNHVAALAVSLALLISVTAIYTPFYSKKKKMRRAVHGGSGGRSSKANAVGFLCGKALNSFSFFLSALRLPREEKRSRYLAHVVRT